MKKINKAIVYAEEIKIWSEDTRFLHIILNNFYPDKILDEMDIEEIENYLKNRIKKGKI